MQIQQNEQHPDKPQDHHRFPWGSVSFVVIVLLSIAVIATIWIYLGTDAGIFCTVLFVAFGAVFAFLQLTPSLFSKTTEPSTAPQIIIHTSPSEHGFTNAVPSSKQNILDATIIPHIDQPSLVERSSSETESLVWNVPYHRNPFFTGREALLEQLHDHFSQAATAAITQPPAITGLGGIGKTQIAIEYAYRHREEYQYVLWVNATEPVTLTEGFVQIARLVQLPIKEEQDQHKVIEAVKQWLTNHNGWLLVLDNADDLNLASEFLPTTGKGHMLLTTRDAATGSLANFEVDKMEKRESMELLLQRAKILTAHAPLSQASEADQTTASTIVEEMDGLPLAIDQAGAYIEETQCSLSAYLKAYQKRRDKLLRQRGAVNKDHPDAVATTWSLNFEQVEQQSPIAADLLRFLAFLAPDAIPEELIMKGANELGEQLEPIAADETLLDEAIGTLRRFSLVQRNSEKYVLFIHRLVQAILKASMTDELRRQWSERTVRAVNHAFPGVEVSTWPQCERLLPHALVCAELINEYALELPEAARLLNETGRYLDDRAQYEQAKPLYERALAFNEQGLGPNHPATATSLNNLAALYDNQGDYEQAKSLYERALAIREQALGHNHPDTARSLNNLAFLYDRQGDYEQAKPLYERALAINEQALGHNHPDTKVVRQNYTRLLEEMKQQGKNT